MEAPYLASERNALAVESHAALTLAANMVASEREPDWLGVPIGVAKMAQKQGQEFSYGAGDAPSDEYLDLLLCQLKEAGVTIRLEGKGAPAFAGNVAGLGADLLRSCKACKLALIDRYKKTYSTWRRRKEYPVLPEYDWPVEWSTLDTWGHCAGEDMPAYWMKWRYLYGETRNTWHSATGWEWEEDVYDEPAFRKRSYKPRRVVAQERASDNEIPG